MEEQNSKEELAISDNPPKRNRKDLEGIGSSDVPCKSMTEALSNFLVLQSIFAHLDGEDLESCYQVNQCWTSVIGQIHPRNFLVNLKIPESKNTREVTNQNHVTIKEIPWSSKPTEEQKYNFPDALKFILEKSSDAKIAIHLKIRIQRCCENEDEINSFLGKIGVFVHKFSPNISNGIWDTTCAHLKSHFPNLHHLDLSWKWTNAGYREFDSDLQEIPEDRVFKSVKKITFGVSRHPVEMVHRTIKLAPNLKEIHEFPLAQVDVLVSTGKAHLVKSIIYPYMGREDSSSMEIAFKKFALLEPKLTSFSFFVGRNFLYRETLQPSVQKIFQSSRDSLETLRICPSENFDFRNVPPLFSLKTIVFDIYWVDFGNVKLFPVDIDLQRIFPNVSVVQICSNLKNDEIGKYFIPSILLPWGTQIKELSITPLFRDAPKAVIQILGECFPSVKSFRFGVDSVPDTLQAILPVIATSWPQMEFLSIDILDHQIRGCSFDSVFTGISDETLATLEDPLGRETFTEAEIEGFRKNSTIRKLAKLKRLKLDYSECLEKENFITKLSRITSLSKEFAFEFLPPTFKIIVRANYGSCVIQDLKRKLSGVAAFDFQVL